MRYTVLAAVLIALAFACGVLSCLYTAYLSENICEGLDETRRLSSQGEWNGAEAAAAEACGRWEKARFKLGLIVKDKDVLEVDAALSAVMSTLEDRDKGELNRELTRAALLVKSIREKERLSLYGIS